MRGCRREGPENLPIRRNFRLAHSGANGYNGAYGACGDAGPGDEGNFPIEDRMLPHALGRPESRRVVRGGAVR